MASNSGKQGSKELLVVQYILIISSWIIESRYRALRYSRKPGESFSCTVAWKPSVYSRWCTYFGNKKLVLCCTVLYQYILLAIIVKTLVHGRKKENAGPVLNFS